MTNTAPIVRRRGARFLTVAALALAGPVLAQGPDDDPIDLSLVAGGQAVNDVATRGSARLNEFRDVQQGAILEFGRLSWTPRNKPWTLSLTAVDAFQKDQRYLLDLRQPARFSLRLGYSELPRFYSSGSRTLWSGVGTDTLTFSDGLRAAAETVASPASAFAAPGLVKLMNEALAAGRPLDLRTQRKAADGTLDYQLSSSLALNLVGRYEERGGVKALDAGTYIRRQALSGVPGTGAGFFWRESIEARGQELIEPLDHRITELGASLHWTYKGHSASAGWYGSYFRNDITALYFDNPFDAPAGRASAIIFDPRSDQEPPKPLGDNTLRGLFARSAVQLWPNNDAQRLFANASVRLGSRTRLNANTSHTQFRQDDPFLPYAESDQVVFSGTAGLPGVVYAKDAPLPQRSLNGKRGLTQADFKLTSRLTDALSARAGYRLYHLADDRPQIFFPGYSSSGDSYFRRGIGQKDSQGNPALFNAVGGYTRQRLGAGLAYRIGRLTLDAEYFRTGYDYEERQVEATAEDSFKGSLRTLAGGVALNAYYQAGRRRFDGGYHVGLEKSGVRAYDVWTRNRNALGLELDAPLGDSLSLNAGAQHARNEYPGAVEGFAYGYGLQDAKSGSVYGGLTWGRGEWSLGAWAGYDRYEWNSLQVTKTSLKADYDPTNRWTRNSSDGVVWLGFDASGALGKNVRLRADLNHQRFSGDWLTTNLATPDINSAVAYPFPDVKDSTFSGRIALLWALRAHVDLEARYWFEPYRLDDFTWDVLQPYVQGTLKETRSSASDVGDQNVSRLLWLDGRYGDYTAHVLSFLVHVTF